MRSVVHLDPPAPFDFPGTATSHGWVILAPNSWNVERNVLTRIERLPSGRVVSLAMTGEGTARKPAIRIEVEHQRKLATRDATAIKSRVGHMFRLDEDFREFHALCRKRGGRWRAVKSGLGRMLRSPTLFEDIVKVICTTNIQWGGTMTMVSGLVEQYGEGGSFPGAEAIAAKHPDEFAASVRMGYRAQYVHELAERVASGSLDLDSFHDPAVPTPDLKKRLVALKGIGPYAAATLLMLLGRYDELPIDTVCRDFVKTHYFNGRVPTDAEILKIYDEWGQWRCLAYWFDMLGARGAG